MQAPEEHGIYASEGEGKTFTLVSEGTHPARCSQVVHVGTQRREWQGKESYQNRVRITWEIPGEFYVHEGKQIPLAIGDKYTLSLNEQSKLRPMLVAWRGKQFTPLELKRFDLKGILGAPCLITVHHKASLLTGKIHAHVGGVTSLPKGLTVPELSRPSAWYTITMGKNAVYLALPEWLRKEADQCLEWNRTPEEVIETPVNVVDEDDSGIPF